MNLLVKSAFLFLALPLAGLAELNADELWHRGSPESQGFSAAKLEALRAGFASRDRLYLFEPLIEAIVGEGEA